MVRRRLRPRPRGRSNHWRPARRPLRAAQAAPAGHGGFRRVLSGLRAGRHPGRSDRLPGTAGPRRRDGAPGPRDRPVDVRRGRSRQGLRRLRRHRRAGLGRRAGAGWSPGRHRGRLAGHLLDQRPDRDSHDLRRTDGRPRVARPALARARPARWAARRADRAVGALPARAGTRARLAGLAARRGRGRGGDRHGIPRAPAPRRPCRWQPAGRPGPAARPRLRCRAGHRLPILRRDRRVLPGPGGLSAVGHRPLRPRVGSAARPVRARVGGHLGARGAAGALGRARAPRRGSRSARRLEPAAPRRHRRRTHTRVVGAGPPPAAGRDRPRAHRSPR